MADNQQHITPTADLIRQYLEGKLDGKIMHALEKQALDDPFLADALEGYAKYPTDQRPALSELQQRLQQRVAPAVAEKKVRRLDYRWLAAASVLLILCISGVMMLNNRTQKAPEIAQAIKVDTTAEQKAILADSAAPTTNATSTKPAEEKVNANVANAPIKTTEANANVARSKKAPEANAEIAPAPPAQPVLAFAPPKGVTLREENRQSKTTIQIRGTSSAKDSNVLVLVDGLPAKMDSINPAEVENVQILKEATASALYGAKAANGVVLVTTKKGKQVPRFGASSLDSAFASHNRIDTINIGSSRPIAGKLDSKVEGLVTGAQSNFSNYYQDDNVQKISGVVVDEKTGKRIPGVSISVNGTNRAVTDTAGGFALHVASKSKAELGFTSLGYAQKKVTVSQSTNNLNVALPANNDRLSETVVVGYSKKVAPVPFIGDEAYSVYLVSIKTEEVPGLKVPVNGKVRISFSVMPDSTLQDFKVLKGLGVEADRIAIQRIKDGPRWIPASDKKKATVEVTVPIELIKKGAQ